MINIPMSAGIIPHRKNLIKLLDAYASAERPILIHCLAGADRSGEAAAIYLQEYMGATKEESLEMLTLKYLHVERFKPAKRYFIREVYQGKEWAYNEYDPCEQTYSHYDQQSCPN